MFKIGEFSKLTQVSIRMLRYYDETGLLKPAEIDKWTGYRLYSVEQIPMLNKIVYLRDSGFLISEIITTLDKKEDYELLAQLDQKYQEIERNIQGEQERLRKINLAKTEILMGKKNMHYNISIKAIPSYQVLSLRRIIPDYYAEGALWQELSAFAAKQQIPLSSDTFSIYHGTSYKETLVDVELCAPVEKFGQNSENFMYRNTCPVPTMACTMAYGDFSNIGKVYWAFSKWLQENSQYQMSGPTRQIVHRGPWNENNPQNYLIELQIPLTLV